MFQIGWDIRRQRLRLGHLTKVTVAGEKLFYHSQFQRRFKSPPDIRLENEAC